MIWSDIARNWSAHVPQILTRWPELGETEVLATEGDRTAFSTLLSRRMNLPASVADSEVADWAMGLESADAMMDPSRDNARISASASEVAPGEDVYDADEAFGDEDAAEPPIGRSAG